MITSFFVLINSSQDDIITTKLFTDPSATLPASQDFGKLTEASPAAAVFRPSSVDDIVSLVSLSYLSSEPFKIAARGHGHSLRGQATAPNGVVVDMRALGGEDDGGRIVVFQGEMYVDVGGEQLWIDVLVETLKHGIAPRSWTDYLYLTVGGTLSNAGVSGQAFLHGPQISNVFELDVITGKGEKITCSENDNSDLFFSVLGGLGQFGIITRARIAVEAAPDRVRWVRLIYTDFVEFTKDQERLISMEGKAEKKGFQYVEGSLLMDQGLISNWRSSFFSGRDLVRVGALAAEHSHIYCLEGSMYYNLAEASSVQQELESVIKELNFVKGFAFTNDVSYLDFLNRVHDGELKLRSKGLWDVPHPWLNIFVPKSRISDINEGVFKGILKNNDSMGPILIYPMNKNKYIYIYISIDD
ncbi:hypothetical protein J5N97_012965 [Dioscorea zingiberensis]|uniref:cytokinin dehydrogenase n=1 Tax=Dioscorea zingiberensis TaxID=325984 RepID=A0A9D5HI76_9LILI|nr:hypothetical protein J5N97_012965 [Dioscorea zingiberensis]